MGRNIKVITERFVYVVRKNRLVKNITSHIIFYENHRWWLLLITTHLPSESSWHFLLSMCVCDFGPKMMCLFEKFSTAMIGGN